MIILSGKILPLQNLVISVRIWQNLLESVRIWQTLDLDWTQTGLNPSPSGRIWQTLSESFRISLTFTDANRMLKNLADTGKLWQILANC